MQSDSNYDALLIVSFGGPEGPEDVLPFLENVLRGKNVPQERMLEVVEHYRHFGGVSPINNQNRALIAALKSEFAEHGVGLPIYWGNRNWHPMIPDILRQMNEDGVSNPLVFFTSMFSCYSGCRQYRENIIDAQSTLGADAPNVHRLRFGYNHPLFIEASASRVQDAFDKILAERRSETRFVFTSHSIPMSMADGSNYALQLREACRLVMEKIGDYSWELVYQSRSGPPTQPWLEPDVCDYISELKQKTDVQDIVVMPVGFVSDHMEVLFDLDTEAQETCDGLGINMARAQSVGVHPSFVSMIRQLVLERTASVEPQVVGKLLANPTVCSQDCCTYCPAKRPDPAAGSGRE